MILSFGSIIISILAFVFALGLIVVIHEGGHFFFARKANILCREYAFGMGPLLWKKKKGETLYSIRALPIGGFCAIAGEEVEDDPLKELKQVKFIIKDGKVVKIICDEKNNLFDTIKSYEIVSYDLFDALDTGYLFIKVKDEEGKEIEFPVDPQAYYVFTKPVKNNKISNEKKLKKYTEEIQIAPHNRTLNAKTKRQRAMVMFGGPLMNFLLAIVVFFFAGLLLGFPNYSSTKLSEISEGSPAYIAGLQEGDKIIELTSGDLTSGEINDWHQLSDFMDKYVTSLTVTDTITVKYVRDNQEFTTNVKPMVVIYSISMIQDINSEDVKIAELSDQSLAYKGGLRTGDIIQAIKYSDSEVYTTVNSWKDVYNIFTGNREGKLMKIKVLRGTETVECEVDPYSKEVFDKTQSVPITNIIMGVSPQTKFSLGKSLIYSITELFASLKNMVNTLGMLFFSSEVGIKDLSGPVGIFSLTSQAASEGFGSLLNFIGFLSVNVGFMNLLPIPALDGGRLVFVAYEAITKKRPSEKVQTILITATMLLLIGLIIFVSFNDVLRLIRG